MPGMPGGVGSVGIRDASASEGNAGKSGAPGMSGGVAGTGGTDICRNESGDLLDEDEGSEARAEAAAASICEKNELLWQVS